MMVDRAIWEKAVFEVLDATGGNIETGGFIDAVLAKVTTATGATPPRGTAASYMSLLLTRGRPPVRPEGSRWRACAFGARPGDRTDRGGSFSSCGPAGRGAGHGRGPGAP